jgi:hypothetical protein
MAHSLRQATLQIYSCASTETTEGRKMESVLFWMVALEIGAVAACITAIAQFEIRRRSSQRPEANLPKKPPVARRPQLDPLIELKLPGRKRMRGYDYPELCSKDSSERLLRVHTVLTRNLQMH